MNDAVQILSRLISARFGLAIAAALSLAACEGGAPSASPGVRKVASTTSFGMCAGYCKTNLEISEGQAVLTRESWGRGAGADLPPQRFTAQLSPQDWQEIARLAAAAKIDALPDVIGCPDCADGGAESLTTKRPAPRRRSRSTTAPRSRRRSRCSTASAPCARS
jgi:hypothetical protein